VSEAHPPQSARPPDRALIYHFTHLDNLASVLAVGRLLSDTAMQAQGGFTEVGDLTIKARRRQCTVTVGPGGMAADYVPFYFAPRSPMMYRIHRDHRDQVEGRYPGGIDPLVYLVSSVDTVVTAGLGWAASDGNCSMATTRHTASEAELSGLVDWPLMAEVYWKNTKEDGDRMRRRAAEFLVHTEFSLDLVLGYAVRTMERAGELADLLQAHGRGNSYRSVRPDWYF
jgi:hypothetical protein